MEALSKNKNQAVEIMRWISRIWGGLVLTFVLFMLTAHLVGSITGKEPEGEGFRNFWEIIAFSCFFVIIIGLFMAYKWEGLGGLIASLGLLIMFTALQISAPEIKLSFTESIKAITLFVLSPGFLYLITWYLSRKIIKS